MVDMEKYPLHYFLIRCYSSFHRFLAIGGCGLHSQIAVRTISEGRDAAHFQHRAVDSTHSNTWAFAAFGRPPLFGLSPRKRVGRMAHSPWWQSVRPSKPKSCRFLQWQRGMHNCCISSSNPSAHLSGCHFCLFDRARIWVTGRRDE